MAKIWWRIAAQNGNPAGTVTEIELEVKRNGKWGTIANLPPNTLVEWSKTSATGPWTAVRTKPSVTVTGRIPEIRITGNGKTTFTPKEYYKNRRAEFINTKTHPMPAMGQITHRQIKSGRWSDPSIWDVGTKPQTGDSVWGGSNMRLILDEQSDVILNWIGGPVDATLTVDPNTHTRIRFCTYMWMGITNIWDEGLSEVAGRPKHEFIVHPVELPLDTGKLGMMPMGPTRIVGAKIRANYRLGVISPQTLPGAPQNATVIHIPGFAAGGGAVGHVLTIGSREYRPLAANDPTYTGPSRYWSSLARIGSVVLNKFQLNYNEEVTVTEVMANDMVRINRPLSRNHFGETSTLPNSEVVTVAPCVSNNYASILFRAASQEEDGAIDPTADLTNLQKRPHFMPMGTDDVSIRYAAFKNFGRSDTNPTLNTPHTVFPYRVELAGGVVTVNPLYDVQGGTELTDPLNVTGKWAFHLHWSGGPYKSSRMVDVVGVRVYAPLSAPPIPGWALVAHGTRSAMEDCFVSHFRGAGFVWELGNEIGQAINCVAMGGIGNGEGVSWGDRAEFYTGHNGHAGVGFELQSRMILLKNCVGVGCQYVALWHSQKPIRNTRQIRWQDIRMADGFISSDIQSWWSRDNSEYKSVWVEEDITVTSPQIPPVFGVEGHACTHGISVIHRGGDVRKYDATPGLFEKCHMIDVPYPIEVPQYSSEYMFTKSLYVGPLNMMHTSRVVTMGTVSQGFSFSFLHMKNYYRAFVDSGMGLNWKGVTVQCTFENVTARESTSYRTITETRARELGIFGIMGPWTRHPTNADSWILRSYDSQPLSALPLNYPLLIQPTDPNRQPLGTGYPAGHSAIAVGAAPVFVLDSDVSTNITLGSRGGISISGVWIDCAGPYLFPSFHSPETFPNGYNSRTPKRTLFKVHGDDIIRRNGCWLDNGVWRTRVHMFNADRVTHARAVTWIDFTITTPTGSSALEFLQFYDRGGPPPLARWADEPELIDGNAPPLKPVVKQLEFLSHTVVNANAGRTLSHDILINEPNVSIEIVPGANSDMFQLASMGRILRFANNGTRPVGTYTVNIRATDCWGNTVTREHQVIVRSTTNVVSSVYDNFEMADGPLESNPNWSIVGSGTAGSIQVTSNTTRSAVGTSQRALYSRVDLGSPDMIISCNLSGWGDAGGLAFRIVDENNYMVWGRRDHPNPTGSFIMMVVNGVWTTLGMFQNTTNRIDIHLDGRTIKLVSVNPDPYVLRVNGTNTFGLIENTSMSDHGLYQLPANAPMGTRVGLKASSRVELNSAWIRNFRADRMYPLGTTV